CRGRCATGRPGTLRPRRASWLAPWTSPTAAIVPPALYTAGHHHPARFALRLAQLVRTMAPMSKPYDAAGKDLVAGYPIDWVCFLDRPAPAVEVIDTDLSTVTAASDKVLKVLDVEPWLLHAELQSGPRTDLDE